MGEFDIDAFLAEQFRLHTDQIMRAILSMPRIRGDRGGVIADLLVILYDRYFRNLPPLAQKEVAAILYPNTYVPGDSKVRKAVARLRLLLEEFFAHEGSQFHLRARIPLSEYRLRFFSVNEVADPFDWLWRPYSLAPQLPHIAILGDSRGAVYDTPHVYYEDDDEPPQLQTFADYCRGTAFVGLARLMGRIRTPPAAKNLQLPVMELANLEDAIRWARALLERPPNTSNVTNTEASPDQCQYTESSDVLRMLRSGKNLVICSTPRLNRGLRRLLEKTVFDIEIANVPAGPGSVGYVREMLRRDGKNSLFAEDSEFTSHSLITRFPLARPGGASQVVTLITAWEPFAISRAASWITSPSLHAPLRQRAGFSGAYAPEAFQVLLKCMTPYEPCGWVSIPSVTIAAARAYSGEHGGGTEGSSRYQKPLRFPELSLDASSENDEH